MKIDFLHSMGLEPKTEEQIQFMQPLVMAYVGDVIFEVFIRTYILHKYGGKVNDLHKIATKFVKAEAQAKIVHGLEHEFSEEEWVIIKRGRNQKSGSTPKNAALVDYKYATGFETLVGYLYLMQKNQRLEEIIKKAIRVIEEEN